MRRHALLLVAPLLIAQARPADAVVDQSLFARVMLCGDGDGDDHLEPAVATVDDRVRHAADGA